MLIRNICKYIYNPLDSNILDELFIVADYKQCAFIIFQGIRQYIHA